jgi:beta-phosphoglucomutase
MQIPGLKNISLKNTPDLIELPTGGNGLWKTGHDGVVSIFTMLDKKADFIVFEDKTLVYIKSAMGYPAIYELKDDVFEGPAEYVLMDLDGTSVHSEAFWIWIIEQTTAALLGNPKFSLEHADEPFVSGHSVSEHLQHCIKKYCPDKTVEEARNHYFRITNFEMNEIMQGRGRDNAFTPAPGLKDFLLELKAKNIKIGLVTSGLYEKAWPEILSAFRTLKMGDPLDFYDAIITAGYSVKKGQAGTLGELSPKPHPWLYAETARVGLGVSPHKRHKVIGLEDSSAGVLSIRLAGFSAIGLSGGNIEQSGARPLLRHYGESLENILPVILGKNQ